MMQFDGNNERNLWMSRYVLKKGQYSEWTALEELDYGERVQ